MRQSRPDYAVPAITEATFGGMRAELLELRHRWNQLAPGDTLELMFTAPCS